MNASQLTSDLLVLAAILDHFGIDSTSIPRGAMTADTNTPGEITLTWAEEYVMGDDGIPMIDGDEVRRRPGRSVTIEFQTVDEAS